MSEAISDTGPILHLSEIDKLFGLNVFDRLYIPELVRDELRRYGLDARELTVSARISIVPVSQERGEEVFRYVRQLCIHPADAEVFILAQDESFSKIVLTDDMELRQQLELRGALVVGSVGILVRAYHKGLMKRDDLDQAIDALFKESTLHLSSAFRGYVRNLLSKIQ